jgi:hypothetical protein
MRTSLAEVRSERWPGLGPSDSLLVTLNSLLVGEMPEFDLPFVLVVPAPPRVLP